MTCVHCGRPVVVDALGPRHRDSGRAPCDPADGDRAGTVRGSTWLLRWVDLDSERPRLVTCYAEPE
jgi:hypothetical protein